MDLKAFKTDQKKEQEGVRVLLGDATLIIARMNNPKHQADFAARTRPFRGATISDETREKLFLESIAEHVLLGWENVEMNGAPLPYNKENARMALAIPDFADFVCGQARDIELFREKQHSEAAAAVSGN